MVENDLDFKFFIGLFCVCRFPNSYLDGCKISNMIGELMIYSLNFIISFIS